MLDKERGHRRNGTAIKVLFLSLGKSRHDVFGRVGPKSRYGEDFISPHQRRKGGAPSILEKGGEKKPRGDCGHLYFGSLSAGT